MGKKKVKWSRYRPGVAQRVGRGIALLFHDRGTRRGWVLSSTPRPHFTPGKEPVHILQETGWAPGSVWTGGKSRPHRDSILDRPARSSVAIPTELPGPLTSTGILWKFIWQLRKWNTQLLRPAPSLSLELNHDNRCRSVFLVLHSVFPHLSALRSSPCVCVSLKMKYRHRFIMLRWEKNKNSEPSYF